MYSKEWTTRLCRKKYFLEKQTKHLNTEDMLREIFSSKRRQGWEYIIYLKEWITKSCEKKYFLEKKTRPGIFFCIKRNDKHGHAKRNISLKKKTRPGVYFVYKGMINMEMQREIFRSRRRQGREYILWGNSDFLAAAQGAAKSWSGLFINFCSLQTIYCTQIYNKQYIIRSQINNLSKTNSRFSL